MKQNEIKYFIYARKSSESEDRQVASIDSQLSELRKIAAERGLNVIEVFSESRSAKAPGRPVFNEMMRRISLGEAQGVLCWKLDRLARNFVDGGVLIEMIQSSSLQHIQTHGRGYFPYDNVMLMAVEFGVAKQFIKDLSENTKRGLLKKAELGWLPSRAPLGYMNERYAMQGEKRILKDEESFELLQKAWKLFLTRTYSVQALYELVIDEWGVRDPKGKKPSRSNFYMIFRNRFYYGEFEYMGKVFKGSHEPMITESEFNEAQDILDGKQKPRASIHEFAFTGMISCFECGAMITAEEKTKHQKNGNSHHYVYYRCTKRKGTCSQKPIKLEQLEDQIQDVLNDITIPKEFVKWAMDCIKEDNKKESDARNVVIQNHQKQYNAILKKIERVIDMRAGDELSEEEYRSKKTELMAEKAQVQKLIDESDSRVDEWLLVVEEAFKFAEVVGSEFKDYSLRGKKQALAALGSNLSLYDGKLSITKRRLFEPIQMAAREVRAIHKRLEPHNTPIKQRDFNQIYDRSPVLGG